MAPPTRAWAVAVIDGYLVSIVIARSKVKIQNAKVLNFIS